MQVVERPSPLRLSSDRVWLYGLTLVAIGLLPLLLFPNVNHRHWFWPALWDSDWSYFAAGGATVGTPALLGQQHIAWQLEHGFGVALPWAYLPAFAYFFVPFAHVSLAIGFWTNAAVMLGACVATGVLCARIYSLPYPLAILGVLAWEPAVVSISGGQNASMALLFVTIFILGFTKRNALIAGLAAGALMFKPTDAIIFALLLLLWRRWRALAVAAGCAVAWYLASVPATAGDWSWPMNYAAALSAWYPHQQYSQWLISVPALLSRIGLPLWLATALGVGMLGAWCFTALRASALEAASFAGLFAVATSAHANPHEAALVVPALFYVATRISDPWRIRIICLAYAIGGSSVVRWMINFDPVSLLLAVGALCYLVLRLPRARSEWLPRAGPEAADGAISDGARLRI